MKHFIYEVGIEIDEKNSDDFLSYNIGSTAFLESFSFKEEAINCAKEYSKKYSDSKIFVDRWISIPEEDLYDLDESFEAIIINGGKNENI